MPAVAGHARAEPRAVGDRDAGVEAIRHVEAPRVGEVVLGSRALERRLRLAVHVEAIVALPEPAGLRLHDREDRADVEAAALHVEEDVRAAVVRRRKLLPVARVEVRRALGQRGDLLPVHLVVEVVDLPPALVRQRHAAGLAERHRPVAVARAAVGARADHRGLDHPLEAVADAEEVAERRVDRGLGAPVVIDAEAHEPRPAVLVGGDGDPQVRHDAGALKIREHDLLAGDRVPAVVVRIRVRARRGRPLGLEVLQVREVERVPRLGDGGRRERESGQSECE